jgi:lysozyme
MDRYSKEELRKELIRDEGKRLTPYRDSLGYWTVGVGHLLEGKELVALVDPESGIVRRKITEKQCLTLLDNDIAVAESRLTEIFPEWETLDEVRKRALLNLSFNLGKKLAKFTRFLGSVRRNEWEKAANSLKASLWYKQVKLRGPRIVHMIGTGSPWAGE